MKLYLAAAVLMLVLAAHTEAQEEPSLEQRFSTFQTQVKDLAEGLAEKIKNTFEDVKESEVTVKTKNWFTEQYNKLREKVVNTFN